MKNVTMLLLIILLLAGVMPACSSGTSEESAMSMFQNKVRAPEFPAGLDWMNTTRPLMLNELRGKVVILDFWTYCCINCHHVIPDLKKLEAKWADELVVIGVHSAKFSTERETENIRQAVLRHEIEHPVVNDAEMGIWRSYGVRAWPTLALIDPEGYVVGMRSGEGIYEVFDDAISRLVEIHEEKGSLDREKEMAAIKPMMHDEPQRLLSFPHKILVDEGSNRLFIADTNNNRIAIVDLESNTIIDFIGGSTAGRADGDFDTARFDKPTGIYLDGGVLYIADTENHLIRKAYLGSRHVETIAGTGKQARRFNLAGDSLQVPLNSPWDVYLKGETLYIANAGSHQIYRMNLESGQLEPHAGSGRENRIDAPLAEAQLAQPSGLTADEDKLYFADSEVSAIRSASFDPQGEVLTVAGGELFEFGKKDAKGLDARFQHPLCVVYENGTVYVADAYNNCIRAVDVQSRQVSTVVGSGAQGMADGPLMQATFDEPAGVDLSGGVLYIADTNNHLIRTANLNTGEVSTLMLKLPLSLSAARVDQLFAGLDEANAMKVAGGADSVALNISLPAGKKLNPLAESLIVIRNQEGFETVVELEQLQQQVTVPAAGDFQLGLVVYYCDEDNEGLCYVESLAVEVSRGDGEQEALSFSIE